MAWSSPISKSSGDLVSASDWNTNTVDNPTALLPVALCWIFDGGGAAYATDDPIPLEVTFKCDITRATMLHDQSATATISIWMDTYANWPPTSGDDISNGGVSTSAADKEQDTSLSGWTTAVPEGSTFYANCDANDNATRTLLSLKALRS